MKRWSSGRVVKAAGRDGIATITANLWDMEQSGQISAHDKLIGSKLAPRTVVANDLPFFRLRIEFAKNHAARQMKEPRDIGDWKSCDYCRAR